MEYTNLEYFIAIAEHHNLTRAAEALYISQPTLTKYLHKLEEELGGKVFRRNGYQYDLTFLGQRYLDYAKKVLALDQDWKKELSDMRSYYKGELNIALPPMRSTSLIPQLLPRFHELYPGVCINFFEYGHSIQDKLISDTNLDFAILSNWQEHPKLNYEHLCNEEILRTAHPLASKAILQNACRYPWLDLSLFADTPFILHFPDQNTGRSAQRLFDQYGLQPPVPFRTRNNQTCIQLASQGLGVTIAPEGYVKYASSFWPVDAFSVGNPPLQNDLVIAYRQNSYLSTYAQGFIALAKEIFRTDGSGTVVKC